MTCERVYGETYAQAIEATGRTHGDLRSMVSVSTRIPPVKRLTTLSWSHHAEVANLEPAEQTRWLEKAESEKQDLAARDRAWPRPSFRVSSPLFGNARDGNRRVRSLLGESWAGSVVVPRRRFPPTTSFPARFAGSGGLLLHLQIAA